MSVLTSPAPKFVELPTRHASASASNMETRLPSGMRREKKIFLKIKGEHKRRHTMSVGPILKETSFDGLWGGIADKKKIFFPSLKRNFIFVQRPQRLPCYAVRPGSTPPTAVPISAAPQKALIASI